LLIEIIVSDATDSSGAMAGGAVKSFPNRSRARARPSFRVAEPTPGPGLECTGSLDSMFYDAGAYWPLRRSDVCLCPTPPPAKATSAWSRWAQRRGQGHAYTW